MSIYAFIKQVIQDIQTQIFLETGDLLSTGTDDVRDMLLYEMNQHQSEVRNQQCCKIKEIIV